MQSYDEKMKYSKTHGLFPFYALDDLYGMVLQLF